jgi:hypothetical protein
VDQNGKPQLGTLHSCNCRNRSTSRSRNISQSSVTLFLGPGFMTDAITVEISDHARLQLQLAYNWCRVCTAAAVEGSTDWGVQAL